MRYNRLFLLLVLLLTLPLCALCDSGEISGCAWNDSKHDLTYNENDATLRSVTVSLYRVESEGETLVEKITTGSSGLFSFTGLPAGNYRLAAELPENFQYVTPQEGGSIMLPACGRESTSPVFSLAENQVLGAMHIGASKSSSYIKAYVFYDENANGGRRKTESLLARVQTELLYEHNGEWVVIARSKTDKEGCATYWQLTPGTYRLAVTLPEEYIVAPLGEKVNAWYNCIIPQDSNYGLSEPFTLDRSGSLGIGIGAVKTGIAEGVVWFDENCNGLRDAQETGFSGAEISLVNETAGVSRLSRSGSDGAYRFDMLAEGEYTLTVTLPADAMFTLPGGDSLFSAGYTLTQSAVISVKKEEITSVQAIGAMPVTQLCVSVYNDLNYNGMLDENEPPFAGAALHVIVDGDLLLSTQSDGEGRAMIPVLRGGDMTLSLTLPEGQVFTVAGENNQFVSLSAQHTVELPVSLPHGEASLFYAGVTLPAVLSGTLFDDSNVSGLPESNEGGLAGFTVQAINASGSVAAETLTDENGNYLFDSLLPAPHAVRFCLTDAYVFSAYSDADTAARNQVITQTADYGDTAFISLTPGCRIESVCGGAFRSATVSGEVLLSAGKAEEVLSGGMSGVYIELLDEFGFPVSDSTVAYTAANGDFYLKGALPGTYSLQFTLPEGCIFTEPLLDSNVYTTTPFTLDAAQDLTLPTLLAVPAGGIAGTIYYDGNANGVFDPDTEATYPGLTVTLCNTDYDMTYETRTMDDGSFFFADLRPGAYTVSVALDSALCFAHDASSLIPADVHSAVTSQFTLLAGQQYSSSNIAAASPASLSGILYFDLINNGLQDSDDPGAAGITVVLQSADALHSYTAITDEDGTFTLSPIVPGNYHLLVTLAGDCIPADGNPARLIDGFYLSDVRIEDGENASLSYAILRYAALSGRVYSMDGTLNGVSGRTVTLFDSSSAELSKTLTDENGVFSFSALKPGDYTLACDLPDATYQFARKGADSVITHADFPVCESISVPMGETVSRRIGIGTPGIIGDIAWLDENKNGLQDTGEKGIPGIEISLWLYGEEAARTVTDGYGRYLFKDIFPGEYEMRVVMPDEIRATVRRADFPLLGSILPESDETCVTVDSVAVPSGGRNLNCDMGFVTVKDGKYPASMENLPQIDWEYEK